MPPAGDDELDPEVALARGLILVRRARFMAAALAGLGLGGSCASAATHGQDQGPEPIETAPEHSSGAEHDPSAPVPDAGVETGAADAGQPTEPAPHPEVCLSVRLD